MSKRQFKLEYMSGSSMSIVTKEWYIRIVLVTEVVYDLEIIPSFRCSLPKTNIEMHFSMSCFILVIKTKAKMKVV